MSSDNRTNALVEQTLSDNAIPYLITRTLAGLVLILAAAAKVEYILNTPFPENQVARILGINEYSDYLQFAIIITELSVGFGLLLGKIYWIGVYLFSFLATASFVMWYFEEASCGCFGRISISPVAIMALDLTFVVGLLVFKFPIKRGDL